MNLAVTRQLAVVQAKAAALDEIARSFTELADIEAHRHFKRDLAAYTAEQHALNIVPTDPAAFVLEEIERIERVLAKAEVVVEEALKVGQVVLNYAAVPLTRASLVAAKEEFDKVSAAFPARRARLAPEFVDDDWKLVPRKIDLCPEVLEFAQLRRPASPILSKRRLDLYEFAFARGPLLEQVKQHFEAVRKACDELLALHGQQHELLEKAHALAEAGNFQEAAKLVEGLRSVFTDLHYQHVNEAIDRWKKPLSDLEQKFQQLKTLVAGGVVLPFAQPWKVAAIRVAREGQFNQMLNRLTHVSQEMESKPGSDFARQCRPLFKTISSALPELQAEVERQCEAARIKAMAKLALTVVGGVVVAVLLVPAMVLAGLAVAVLVIGGGAAVLDRWLLARTCVEFAVEANGKIVSDETHGRIFLNDQPVLPGARLKPGTYRLTVDVTVYEAFEQHVELRYGRRNSVGVVKLKLARENYVNSLGMVFVPVPGASVLFCVWPTRVQDYESFLKATGLPIPRPPFHQKWNYPVVNVRYDDAVAFCLWLTERERKEGRIGNQNQYRVPTDLEWSAAVGLGKEPGNTPAERDRQTANVFPWGTQWPPPRGAGNYDPSMRTDEFDFTSPVDHFAPNHLGLYDLGGNVWEWCSDFYDHTPTNRVLRGASWHSSGAERLLSSFRLFNSPGHRVTSIGFRCVLEGKRPSSSSTSMLKKEAKPA